jgi:DNA polymerase III subunit gamma/tau
VQTAGKPIAAAEMVLVRIAYAADLPTPDEVVRLLDQGSGAEPRQPEAATRPATSAMPPTSEARSPAIRSEMPRPDTSRGTPRMALAPTLAAEPQGAPEKAPRVIARFEELIALAGEVRDLQTKAALERDIRLVRCEDGRLEIALEPNASKALVGELGRKLSDWTGRRWMVVVSAEAGQPTVRSQQTARRSALENDVRTDPLVQAVLAKYPGAEIVAVRTPEAEGIPAPSAEEPPPYDEIPDYDDEP